ncbi:cobyric acid synthase [Salinigranum salinum]|uniref:cobyric acid synthase n=1 Tax=Salinigranum salinum TaxID=1364937 RepID=UPI001261322F|nr:cobyric acid synthase [Salinigranum salinum]
MSTLLVAGTASHVGKSTVAAGLCRLLADRGVDVTPFKAQNMSTNARAVPRTAGDGFGEIGISQYVQARAARVAPTTDHNPVLLKPQGDGESQLVVDGRVRATVAAGGYYDDHWQHAREAAAAAHGRLAAAHDLVVAEGAGSVAEINLHHRDLANVETARVARDAVGSGSVAILLVADIERGGVFAAIVGTLELVPDDLRDLVCGVVVTKFRGDRSLLDSGLRAVETRTGVPVLGVLPFDDPGLPEEDSVAVPQSGTVRGATRDTGTDTGVDSSDGRLDDADAGVLVVVPRLPHIANYTDLGPLEAEPGVRVAYRALDAGIEDADAVVLPGTKNTVDDLLALHAAGYGERLRAFRGPIVGLCGGYQLLGDRLTNAAVEGTGDDDVVEGVGLLPVETRFSSEKHVVATELRLDADTGPLAGVHDRVSGYQIHQGRTRATADVETPFAPVDGDPTAALGAARGRVVGTYLHGLFENRPVRDRLVGSLFEASGETRPDAEESASTPYDRVAALVSGMDVDAVLDAVGVDG